MCVRRGAGGKGKGENSGNEGGRERGTGVRGCRRWGMEGRETGRGDRDGVDVRGTWERGWRWGWN